MKFLFRTSFVALLLAGVVLAGVGSDVVSTEASAASGGLSVSGVAVAPHYYCVSYEDSDFAQNCRNFTNGEGQGNSKDNAYKVRPVRAFG